MSFTLYLAIFKLYHVRLCTDTAADAAKWYTTIGVFSDIGVYSDVNLLKLAIIRELRSALIIN